ncbi:uncharacterized BrkB/YihY/UPF0761 family membrane protein [Motilibacter rhizosphaerae]|uniref:Uncharacterized BrkB/YihY/UPF0761 family membrane protein n=1 Tax=Motilibacter rhizosphaerae TaxID=598652 RepID=A0A4Q7NAP6_9ACTN|nr:YhjD/YihY/BrkB family envelope integrity protein [Motilibacter rhizosphaerae]RZS79989.1 uncharacterized BrkB/YihY/UPF0761 family membrane protein [Motilibacter rhizosphaerae]
MLTERLDRLQRRHPALGLPIAVAYKFFDDQGNYLAALIAYYSFVSLIPLLLLVSTVLQYVLVGHPERQQEILHSALHDFPVVGAQLQHPGHLGGGVAGLVIGTLVALYGALGVTQVVQNAMNTAWAVPRNERPNPVRARLRGLVLLAVAAVSVVGTTALSVVAQSGGLLTSLLLLASVTLNAAVLLVVFRTGTARHVSWTDVAPGAVGTAVVWQVLQSSATAYVAGVVRHASATNSVFAVVLGLLAFLYLAALALVVCVEVDVVRVDRLHPRALLTPFTDDVQLTSGDERVYAGAAKAQRTKGFERVDVDFDGPRPDRD